MEKNGAYGKEAIGPDDFSQMPDRVDPQVYKHNLAAINRIFFDVIDSNHDGYIQRKEFEVYFRNFGIDVSNAEESFKMTDTNGDGVLSKEEFVGAGLEFCCSKEDTPTKLFLWTTCRLKSGNSKLHLTLQILKLQIDLSHNHYTQVALSILQND